MKHIPFLILAGIVLTIGGCKSNSTNPSNPSGSAPVIRSFTAQPAAINIGDSTLLSWAIDNDPTSVTIDQNIGDVTNRSSLALYPAQTATYTLTAKNSSGQVTATATVTVNNPSDPGAPPNPLNLTATTGNPGIINLNWTASTGASSYAIERKSIFGFVQINSASVNSFTDGGLYPGVLYTYRVRALNASGAHSGYSNYAWATAPGTAPVIDHISIIPTAPPTLQPLGTVQFTATAYDASGNNLGFAQNIFGWNSTAPQIVSVTQTGLATAGNQQGVAAITASLGGVTSNTVNVNVSLQQNHILVIFNPISEDPGFAPYTAALASFGVDYLTDNNNGGPTTISFNQIKSYDRVFYCTHNDEPADATTTALLQEYAMQAGKRLIIMCGSDFIENDQGFMSFLGISNDGWEHTSDMSSIFTGQSNTAMAGFNFMRVASFDYTSDLTLDESGKSLAALTGTLTSDPATPIVISTQSNVGSNTKVFYNGFVLENVQADKQTAFMSLLINSF